jgi:UDP-N-acetylmuramyl pentapeptide synthase
MDSNPDFLELTGKTAILVKASREMKFERIVKKLKVAIE